MDNAGQNGSIHVESHEMGRIHIMCEAFIEEKVIEGFQFNEREKA